VSMSRPGRRKRVCRSVATEDARTQLQDPSAGNDVEGCCTSMVPAFPVKSREQHPDHALVVESTSLSIAPACDER
jgi:hypothetical protein